MDSSELAILDMNTVRDQYDLRASVSSELRLLLESGTPQAFVQLALGISESHGNYSASEHGLGPRILDRSPASRVVQLAQELSACVRPIDMVRTIYEARIPYLKISVGSEMAAMLNPESFWVANTRTVWAHLLIKHEFSYRIANEALKLYRTQDTTSEMDYAIWKDIYTVMKPDLDTLGHLGDEQALLHNVVSGEVRNLWSDAVANALYGMNE